MKIEIETDSYNERRHGKPWIAVVDFSTSAQGKYRWGEWVGDARNGGAGTLLVDANPGDIIAQGQKDFRKMRNSAPVFYHVESDGSLSRIGDKGKAYSFWRGVQDGMAEKEQERTSEDGRPLRMIDVEPEEPTEPVQPVQEGPLAAISDEDLLAEVRRRGLAV